MNRPYGVLTCSAYSLQVILKCVGAVHEPPCQVLDELGNLMLE